MRLVPHRHPFVWPHAVVIRHPRHERAHDRRGTAAVRLCHAVDAQRNLNVYDYHEVLHGVDIRQG